MRFRIEVVVVFDIANQHSFFRDGRKSASSTVAYPFPNVKRLFASRESICCSWHMYRRTATEPILGSSSGSSSASGLASRICARSSDILFFSCWWIIDLVSTPEVTIVWHASQRRSYVTAQLCSPADSNSAYARKRMNTDPMAASDPYVHNFLLNALLVCFFPYPAGFCLSLFSDQ